MSDLFEQMGKVEGWLITNFVLEDGDSAVPVFEEVDEKDVVRQELWFVNSEHYIYRHRILGGEWSPLTVCLGSTCEPYEDEPLDQPWDGQSLAPDAFTPAVRVALDAAIVNDEESVHPMIRDAWDAWDGWWAVRGNAQRGYVPESGGFKLPHEGESIVLKAAVTKSVTIPLVHAEHVKAFNEWAQSGPGVTHVRELTPEEREYYNKKTYPAKEVGWCIPKDAEIGRDVIEFTRDEIKVLKGILTRLADLGSPSLYALLLRNWDELDEFQMYPECPDVEALVRRFAGKFDAQPE